MTEKRFMLDDAGELIDLNNHQFIDYGDEVCNLLNEQHEQIQELIQSSKELEEDCQSTFNAMSRKQDDLYRKNFKLKEENEQLEKEKKELKKENEQLQQKYDKIVKFIRRNHAVGMIHRILKGDD